MGAEEFALATTPTSTLIDSIKPWLQERLSPHRYQHSLGVAATARELAERFGADADRAELAGLLHDAAREWRPPQLLEGAREAGLEVTYMEEMAPMPCLHGPLGAEVAKREFGVADAELLEAIAHHTMGRERMGLLERVVFLADAIEPNRPSMPYIDELRELAHKDLNLACRRAYDHTFDYLLRTGQPIHPVASAGRNWLLYCEKENR
jgi:predicted HD superfamily hydrolase involved in NAD metabolism